MDRPKIPVPTGACNPLAPSDVYYCYHLLLKSHQFDEDVKSRSKISNIISYCLFAYG